MAAAANLVLSIAMPRLLLDLPEDAFSILRTSPVSRRWVSNASPLIVLGKVNQVDLLTGHRDELVIPEAVADEILQGAAEDPARQWLIAHGEQYVGAWELIAWPWRDGIWSK